MNRRPPEPHSGALPGCATPRFAFTFFKDSSIIYCYEQTKDAPSTLAIDGHTSNVLTLCLEQLSSREITLQANVGEEQSVL